MIDSFKTDEQVSEFIKAQYDNSHDERQTAAQYAATNRMYDIGMQWLTQRQTPTTQAKISRQVTDWVGANGPIRATINRITKYIRQVKAATNPSRLYVDALPPLWSQSLADADLADILETAANMVIDEIGLLGCARRANFERCVAGDHGVGLALERTSDGTRLRAFDFDYGQLILDPANMHQDLTQHEHVILEDVWTIHKVRRVLGEGRLAGVDVDKLHTVGQLMPVQMAFASLTGDKLYGEYRKFSSTKGMRVWQTWLRGRDGSFDRMYFSVDANQGKTITTNLEDPANPFAGDGMPLILIHGHERPKSRRSISDVAMMRDDQDRLNLVMSLFYQQMYNYTGRYKWLVDRGWFGELGGDDNKIIEALKRNYVLTRRPVSDKHQPPQLATMPSPDQNLALEGERSDVAMRQSVFRAEVQQGTLKTHQTNRGLQLSIEQTELPLDDRINTDVLSYERLIHVATATMIRLAQSGDGVATATMRRQGFGDQEFQALARVDTRRLPADIKIRDQAIRHRSRQTRRQELFDAAASGAIQDPGLIRRIMARELDMPISDTDKLAVRFARQAVRRVVLGEEWVPLPLGEYSQTVIDEFRAALMTREVAQIPDSFARLAEAINAQRELMMAELAPPEAAQEPAVEPPVEAGPLDTVSFPEIIGSVGSGLRQAIAS